MYIVLCTMYIHMTLYYVLYSMGKKRRTMIYHNGTMRNVQCAVCYVLCTAHCAMFTVAMLCAVSSVLCNHWEVACLLLVHMLGSKKVKVLCRHVHVPTASMLTINVVGTGL
jgi:hypothetical protein